MPKKIRILLIGPRPPNVGGISSYIRDFTYNIKKTYNYDILPVTTYIIKTSSIKDLCLKAYSILFNTLKITFFIFNNKYDIAHIHTSSKFSFLENSLYVFCLTTFSHCPVILHIHAPDFDTFLKNSNSIISIIIKFTLNSCDAIIVLSNYWKRVISEVVNQSNNVFIIPNAAEISSLEEPKIQSRKRLNIPNNKKVLFSLGNLEERKGYSYLIESMSTVCKERRDVYCVIGGSGPMKSSLESKVDELYLNEYVKFVGFIPDNELKFWFNACDFFVLPSLAEGSPIVMFEALNFGKPFIGTSVGGIPDVIISEDYGSLVEAGNSKDLSQKILYALKKDWDSECIKKYSAQFNWDAISKKIVEGVYLKLMRV